MIALLPLTFLFVLLMRLVIKKVLLVWVACRYKGSSLQNPVIMTEFLAFMADNALAFLQVVKNYVCPSSFLYVSIGQKVTRRSSWWATQKCLGLHFIPAIIFFIDRIGYLLKTLELCLCCSNLVYIMLF